MSHPIILLFFSGCSVSSLYTGFTLQAFYMGVIIAAKHPTHRKGREHIKPGMNIESMFIFILAELDGLQQVTIRT